MKPASTIDYRALAQRRLPHFLFEYYDGGSYGEVTLRRNIADLIADAVGDRLTVLADGGVRSGLDVVRMLALGAKGVLLGRAWAFALAGGGQAGVAHMLRLIEAEMRVAMALTARTSIAAIDRSILVDGPAMIHRHLPR
jgi:L-lactate dehydrogenase (cytochrome)